MPALLDSFFPTGGRHRRLSSKAVLVGIMAALDSGRPAQLASAHAALSELPPADQLRLGAARFSGAGVEATSYRQFSDTFSLMMRAIDPSPVPSFRNVAGDGRRAHLEAARGGVEVAACRGLLDKVTDLLLEASIPQADRSASTSLAVDWSDYETFARPRPKNDPQPSADPDASWGHAKRNAPGAKDCLFYGYYGQVATMVREVGGDEVPELVRRACLEAPRVDPAGLMADTLLRLSASGVVPGEVLADCGYSNREPATFAVPLRRAGFRLVVDLHPDDRGPKGTFEGAICANGQLYCPATPPALLGRGPLRRGAGAEETAAHDRAGEELARYKLSRISAPDRDGYERVACPAAKGKIHCPLQPSSMVLANDRPSVLAPPKVPPRCCRQQTITVPPQVNAKTRQANDYLSRSWRLSYARRTGAERSFAHCSDPSTGAIGRGWCRLAGRAKNAVMYALFWVVSNVRLLESFERRKADEARRAAIGPRRRRRRRYGTEEQTASRDEPGEVLVSPD